MTGPGMDAGEGVGAIGYVAEGREIVITPPITLDADAAQGGSLAELMGLYSRRYSAPVVFLDGEAPEGLARIINENSLALAQENGRLVVVTSSTTLPRSLRTSGAKYDEMELSDGVEHPRRAVEALLAPSLQGTLRYSTLRTNGQFSGIIVERKSAPQEPK